MGSGAFLLAACRALGGHVARAWARERVGSPETLERRARRAVARRCLYGVDKNPAAVELARLSLWLETAAPGEPLALHDHALRCGDSLVGLGRAQLRRLHWDIGADDEVAGVSAHARDAAIAAVAAALDRSVTGEPDARARARLQLRLAADVVTGSSSQAAPRPSGRARVGGRSRASPRGCARAPTSRRGRSRGSPRAGGRAARFTGRSNFRTCFFGKALAASTWSSATRPSPARTG
ncbi:MAG: hypothetical protein H6713_35170 [Myxococcales bacterium]|nr:hypothetical protein [Myxococcales bacterium]